MLDVMGNQVSNSGLQLLETCPNLTSLNIAQSKVSADGLKNLTGISGLEGLGIDVTQASEQGLRHIANLPKLKNLTVFGATDETAKRLLVLSGNRTIMLFDTTLTEDSIPVLSQIKTIRSLSFASDELLFGKWRRFKAALPGCSIQSPTTLMNTDPANSADKRSCFVAAATPF
jgi:hypothetical protein